MPGQLVGCFPSLNQAAESHIVGYDYAQGESPMSALPTVQREPMFAKVPTMREDIIHTNDVQSIIHDLSILDSSLAAGRVLELDSDLRTRVLRAMNPVTIDSILTHLSDEDRERVCSDVPRHLRAQWELNRSYESGSVGRLMDPPVAIFRADLTVRQAIAELQTLVRTEFITYAYVTDEQDSLVGVIVMRDLLFANGDERLDEIMVRNPYGLRPETDLMDAMKQVVVHHYPVYPVVDDRNRILGLVRGQRLFESQTYEIIAQAGSMVGVDKEEQVTTRWTRSFRFRHPWLQLNLLTAFVAGAVVSIFQDTIDTMVVLAAFLPVLAGQSGNTGCQALAVTLRGMTLGELDKKTARTAVSKEALLGLLNGCLVGVSAGVGMYFLARSQGNKDAFVLSLIVWVAMMGSCIISGISGALIPLALKRLGADPATASSIFLTTATDVASMGMLLGLATWILL